VPERVQREPFAGDGEAGRFDCGAGVAANAVALAVAGALAETT
jgi:hypothetical protein